jgi:aerobic-type carbon monoxide dehydrogenase small subunit (CoxS/CutS family)
VTRRTAAELGRVDPMAPVEIELNVNGARRVLMVRPWRLLVDVLREDLGLTGTKAGCRHGVCGSCTVLVDGVPLKSCLVLAVQLDGCEILTVEGLSRDGRLHPLQESFVEEGAVQCGFCTPGLIMSSFWLLNNYPQPSEAEIREAIGGNICRCTGYVKVLRAIRAAAERIRAEGEPA